MTEKLTRGVIEQWLLDVRDKFDSQDICRHLQIVSPEGKSLLTQILNALEDEGRICRNGSGGYYKMDYTQFPVIRNLQGVQVELVNWLWFPYIPYGKLTLIEGDPGIGKSWLSLAIITAISLGFGIPGQSDISNGPCLIASAEDGLEDTIKPRLISMKANCELISACSGLFTLDEIGFQWLENKIIENLPVLLVIDPLVAYLSGTLDIHKANQVRYATARLSNIAGKYGIAIIAIRHLTKGQSSKAIYRGLGSIDFTAAARSVLLVGEDEDTKQRGFVHIKSNLAPLGEPVGYELKDGQFYWLDHCELTSEKILQPTVDRDTPERNEATSFISDILKDGPVPAHEIYDKALNVGGIAKRTLDRAKKQLRVESYKEGEKGKKGGGIWYWFLPDN